VIGNRLEPQLALHLEHVADLVEDPGEIAVGQPAGWLVAVGFAQVGVGELRMGGSVRGQVDVDSGRGRRIRAGDAAGHGGDGTGRTRPTGSQPATTRSLPARFAR
jgi:hypothetical protein